MSLIRTNIKNMALVLMAINQYVLMINLKSHQSYMSEDAAYNIINSMVEES